jgi:asparagine synthase (glutamine-hydrolysing)
MMTASQICLSQTPFGSAPLQFPCGDAWLACSGASSWHEDEQGVLVIYGYIHNVDFNKAPAYWVALLQQDNDELCQQLNQLDGAFNLLLLDKQTRRCTVVTDRFGGQRLYYHQDETSLWLSSQHDHIAALIPQKTFEPAGLMESLHFRWLSGTHSNLTASKKLPHAAVISLHNRSEPKVLQRYGLMPVKNTSPELSLDEHASEVQRLLSDNIAASVCSTDKVAVLLSGGVDSSILLALCCELGLQPVAVTPVHEGHSNPELDTAITFAKQLGVEHRVLEISDTDIESLFCDTALQLAGAPRCHSAISLQYIMRQLEGEFDKVMYGEGADTLFGSRTVKHFANRYKKYNQLQKMLGRLPGSRHVIQLLPEANKLKSLANFNVHKAALGVGQLELSDSIVRALPQYLALNPSGILQQYNTDESRGDSPAPILRYLKQCIISTDVTNHFFELGSLAYACRLKLVSPFVSWPVLSYAAQLSDEHYFGQNFVKPILRKIGERFYSPELMYLPKLGFPVPHKSWLSGPLRNLSVKAAKFFDVPTAWLADDEFAWTLCGLYVIAMHYSVEPIALVRNCSETK